MCKAALHVSCYMLLHAFYVHVPYTFQFECSCMWALTVYHKLLFPCLVQSYYGGEARCAQAAAVSDEYDPSELVCPACSNVGGAAVQVSCGVPGSNFLPLSRYLNTDLLKGQSRCFHFLTYM